MFAMKSNSWRTGRELFATSWDLYKPASLWINLTSTISRKGYSRYRKKRTISMEHSKTQMGKLQNTNLDWCYSINYSTWQVPLSNRPIWRFFRIIHFSPSWKGIGCFRRNGSKRTTRCSARPPKWPRRRRPPWPERQPAEMVHPRRMQVPNEKYVRHVCVFCFFVLVRLFCWVMLDLMFFFCFDWMW